MPKILINTVSAIELVDRNSIYHISNLKEITKIVFKDNFISSIDSLGKLESELPSTIFYRCHKSHLVNLNHVLRIHKSGYVELSNGSKVDIARRRMAEFIDIIRDYITD